MATDWGEVALVDASANSRARDDYSVPPSQDFKTVPASSCAGTTYAVSRESEVELHMIPRDHFTSITTNIAATAARLRACLDSAYRKEKAGRERPA